MNNITITEDQQKIIDLIRTGEPKNVRMALVLDITQSLGVDIIYAAFFKKYSLSLDEPQNFVEVRQLFPIVSALDLGMNLKDSFSKKHELKHFDNKPNLFFDYLKDLKKLIFNDFDQIELLLDFEHKILFTKAQIKIYKSEIKKITDLKYKDIVFTYRYKR